MDTSLAETLETASTVLSTGLAIVLVGNYALNLIAVASLNQLIGSIKKLQIIVHLMLIDVPVPPNASLFFNYLLTIVAFDPVPTDHPIDTMMKLIKREPLSASF